jgi:hypothetical protein
MAGKGSAKGERRGGRKLGTPNQMPDLRAMTLRALVKAGGIDYLEQQAHANPGFFMGLLGRVMPREVHTELTAEVIHRQEVRRDLVEKLIVLLHGELPDAPGLPALIHDPGPMLKAQASTDRDMLGRRAENARREAAGAVSGAVHRAAAMHLDRSMGSASSAQDSGAQDAQDVRQDAQDAA